MEDRTIEFFEAFRPPTTTHNDLVPYRKADGKIGIRKGSALKAAEALWESRLAAHAPKEPLEGPLSVELRVAWPSGGRHAHGEPKTTPPDSDNVEKVVYDCMERLGYFGNDAQVCASSTMRMYSEVPGLWCRVSRLSEGR